MVCLGRAEERDVPVGIPCVDVQLRALEKSFDPGEVVQLDGRDESPVNRVGEDI